MTTESWNDGTVFELLFKIKERETTVSKEIFTGYKLITMHSHTCIHSLYYLGFIQYFACSYFLAILPTFAAKVGYDKDAIFISTAIFSGMYFT